MGELILNALLSLVRVYVNKKLGCIKTSNYLYYKMLLSTELYLMQSNICYGNNTVFNENDVDDGPDSGITCFRRGSTSTEYTLTNVLGDNQACDSGVVRCVPGSGFLTVYAVTGCGSSRNGMYTCCIDGLCISTRIHTRSEYNDLFDSGELYEFKSIIV